MMNMTATSLHGKIAELTARLKTMGQQEMIATLGVEIQKLAESSIASQVLEVGDRAPGFSLPDSLGNEVRLADLIARGPVVVTFYRGGWCPFCDLQLRSYQEIFGDIQSRGAALVAISPQTQFHSLSTAEKKGLSFIVLSDRKNRVAREFGLVFQLSGVLQDLQKALDQDTPRFNDDDSWELPMPGTFVLDPNGIIRLAHVNPDFTRRLEPAEILAALQAMPRPL